MHKLQPLLWLALAVPMLALAETSVYRWVDAQGRVHFGDPASAPSAAERVNPPPVTTTAAVPKDATPEAERQADGGECARARTRLTTYLAAERVIETDALGQQREYSGDQREQLIARAELEANQACSGIPAADEGPE